MKRAVLIGLTVLLAALGAYCGWRYYHDAYLPNKQVADALQAQNAVFRQIKPDLAQASAARAPERELPETDAPDPLAALRQYNSDAVGWLSIAGTTVDYPLVQGTDNDFYLKNGFDRQENAGLGCPFLDYRCESGFTGFNSVIYAHYIPGKQELFADIAEYKNSEFLREHPRGALLTRDGVHEVLFFAYLTVPSTSFVYRTQFENRAERDAYIDSLFENAAYSSGITAGECKQSAELRLLLLSTCTYEYDKARGVLVGVIQ